MIEDGIRGVRRWLMRPICGRKSLGQWEHRKVAAVADVAVPFLRFLRSSVVVFLLASDFRFTFNNFTTLISVLCQIFQAIRNDTKKFHEDLQCVFEALFLASFGALALRQFAVAQFHREVVIFHADRTDPTKLCLYQVGVDTGKTSQS